MTLASILMVSSRLGIPIHPLMTMDLYDKVAALEQRVRELEGRASAS